MGRLWKHLTVILFMTVSAFAYCWDCIYSYKIHFQDEDLIFKYSEKYGVDYRLLFTVYTTDKEIDKLSKNWKKEVDASGSYLVKTIAPIPLNVGNNMGFSDESILRNKEKNIDNAAQILYMCAMPYPRYVNLPETYLFTFTCFYEGFMGFRKKFGLDPNVTLPNKAMYDPARNEKALKAVKRVEKIKQVFIESNFHRNNIRYRRTGGFVGW